MSSSKLITRLVLALLVVSGSVAPVAAESFFSKLFGWGSSKPNAEPAQVSRAPALTHQSRDAGGGAAERGGDGSTRRGGSKIRTMCVRLCDGYYFPISHNTTARHLHSDSDRCKSSCNGEGRLFYTDADNTDHASMIDFTGRRYDALKTAFFYRKALQPGCACKPAPWSAAARMRHMSYALNDAARQARERAVAAARPLGNDRDTHEPTGRGETLAASRPQPAVVAELRPTSHESQAHESDTDDTGLTPTQAPVAVPVPVMGWSGQHRSAAEHEAGEGDEFHRGSPPGNQGGVVRRGRSIGAARAPARRPDQHARPHRQAPAPSHSAAASGGGLFGFAGGKPQVWPGDHR